MIILSKEQIAERLNAAALAQAISDGSVPGRTSSRQITVADLTGIAAQDIAVAQAVISP